MHFTYICHILFKLAGFIAGMLLEIRRSWDLFFVFLFYLVEFYAEVSLLWWWRMEARSLGVSCHFNLPLPLNVLGNLQGRLSLLNQLYL
jgi:hypothetical protein